MPPSHIVITMGEAIVWTHFLKIATWRTEVASLYSVNGCPSIFPKNALSFRPPHRDPLRGRPAFWAGVELIFSPRSEISPFSAGALWSVVRGSPHQKAPLLSHEAKRSEISPRVRSAHLVEMTVEFYKKKTGV